jgi:hypothetical protein
MPSEAVTTFWPLHRKKSARIAEKLAGSERESKTIAPVPDRIHLIEHTTGGVLFIGILSLAWMIIRASNLILGPPTTLEVVIVIVIWVVLFLMVSYLGWFSTRPPNRRLPRPTAQPES